MAISKILKNGFMDYIRKQEKLLPGMNKDEYLSMIDNMNEQEWEYMLARSHQDVQKIIGTEKADEFLKSLDEGVLPAVILKNNITADDSAPVRLMRDDENKEIYEIIDKNHASDIVKLDHVADKMICKMWTDGMKLIDGKAYIPSDLFFSGTIPLMDCEIHIDETKNERLDPVTRRVIKYRIIVLDDYSERLYLAKEWDTVTVALLIVYFDTGVKKVPYIIMEIKCLIGNDFILRSNRMGYRYFDKDDMKVINYKILNPNNLELLSQDFFAYMETWYGVQISLLHPVYKEMYRNPIRNETVKMKKPKGGKGKPRRSVRVTRNYYINANSFDDVIPEKYRGYNRKTLAWYVIGHKRYKGTPKEQWIPGQWRGPLRHLKMNLDEGRDRIVNKEINDVQ